MSFAVNKLQAGIIKEHTDAGCVLASRRKAAGIGLLMCVVLFASIIGVVFLTAGPSGTRMAVGSSEIYFSGSATKTDAEALATDLKGAGFLSEDRAMTIALSKDAGGFAVSFVVTEHAIGSPEVIAGFRAVGEELAAGARGRPLTVWLCDDAMNRKKKIVIE